MGKWGPVLGTGRLISPAHFKEQIAPTSVGSENEIPLLRNGLPATWVVWGGYQKIGSRIRLTAHFSRTATAELMGSLKADGMLEDIFQLEDQIVTGLLEALSISLSGAEKVKSKSRRPPASS